MDLLSKLDTLIEYIDTNNMSNESQKEHEQKGNETDFCLCCGQSNSQVSSIKGSKINGEINNTEKIRKLDIHCHILPKHIPDWGKQFGYPGFIRLEHDPTITDKAQMWQDDTFFREIDEKCWSPEARLVDMNNEGVTVQVLSTVPVLFNYWAKPNDCYKTSQYYNNEIYKITLKYPKRFQGLGTLPMQDIKLAIIELRRCINELNFVGIEIGSNINNINLDDKIFDPLWKEAELLNCCIFVHPWNMMGKKYIRKYWLPWLVSMPAETSRAICSLMFGGIFKKYPKLRFCFAHNGGTFAHTIGRIVHGYNCRPDLIQINISGNENNPYNYLGHFWVDSLIHDKNALMYSLNVYGKNRICLGTDYPFPLGECYPLKKCGQLVENINNSVFDKKMKEQILWYNGLDLIGKNENDFMIDNKNKNKNTLATKKNENKNKNENENENENVVTPND